MSAPASPSNPAPLLEVRNLSIRFRSRGNVLEAVRNASFQLQEGRTLAVVGESGSGKSVTALALTRLLPPPPLCEMEGSIRLRGRELSTLKESEIRHVRGARIAYIFQEPSTSLNPYFSIGNQIAEAIRLHRPEVSDIKSEVVRALDLVGIRDAGTRYRDFPHEMSGGMKQRVMIAMALACQPDILVADEPTTALDVTIEAQIISLLRDLRERLGMSVILITHNFGIVDGFADDLIVMFRGKIVEAGVCEDILRHPQHPYTRALIRCIPKLGLKEHRLATINHAELLANEK